MTRVILVCLLLGSAALSNGVSQPASGKNATTQLAKNADAAAGSPVAAPAAVTTWPAAIHQFTVKDIDGRDRLLAEYRGKVLLVVNVASKCGFTPQYEGLQKLYEKYKDGGLVVLGVPSNDFAGQEPGTEAQIKTFCSTKYGVTFPMLAKVSVKNGPDQCDLYNYLAHKSRNGVLDAQISWNFSKFLIGRDGRVIGYFPSKVKPDDQKLVDAIEAALGTSPS
jgi:glutathione peroxidase